jgi:tetratricopeptide (TPR) repeat protein
MRGTKWLRFFGLALRSNGFVFSLVILLPAFSLSSPVAATASQTAPAPRLSPEDMGDVYMARKMYREAIDSYKDGETQAKTSERKAILADKVGIAWHQLGEPGAALKAYQRAVKFDSKYADAINNVGTIYYSQKRYGRAISQYRRALALTPDAAAIWSNLGTAYYARRRFAEMADAYAKAISLDPTVFEARNGPGTQMQDRGVEDKARYHFEMAKIYAKSGKNDLALQYLRKSMEEGFKDKDKIEKEPEFAVLRETPEYKELMTLEPRVL